jgi:hypothetical protein
VRPRLYPPHWPEKGVPGVRAYRNGCRCERCTAANAENQAAYRRRAGRKKYNGRW